VADDGGYGFAIAKALAEAGATVCAGTWPPALNIFLNLLERGKIDDSRRMPDGALLQFEKIYPLDATFDTLAEAPEEIRGNKRYKDVGDSQSAGSPSVWCRTSATGHWTSWSTRSPMVPKSRNAARHEPGRLPRRGERERLFPRVARRPVGPLTRPGGSFLSLTYMASERWCRATAAGCLLQRRHWRAIRGRWRSRPAASTECG